MGDEDRTTQGLRRRAFARALRAQGDVVVDMHKLGFADTSLMLDLVMLAGRLGRRERTLLLRAPQPHIQALIEMVGLTRFPGVCMEAISPAVA